jgi:hypothetical protein
MMNDEFFLKFIIHHSSLLSLKYSLAASSNALQVSLTNLKATKYALFITIQMVPPSINQHDAS